MAQVGGSILATYTGKLVYGLKAEFVITRPLHGCTSAFFVELLATFIVLFLTASLTNDPQSVRSIILIAKIPSNIFWILFVTYRY